MSEPRDDPETEPEPTLYGIVFVFCRGFGLPLGFPEASAEDLDEDLRRRVVLEYAGFSSETDERPVGGVLEFIAVDWAASVNCDWSCWSAMVPTLRLLKELNLSPPQSDVRKIFY